LIVLTKIILIIIKILEIVNLESLQLDKFQDKALKKEQMFKLNGGEGTATAGGHMANGTHNGSPASFDYSYDSDRGDGVITYHERSNVRRLGIE